MGQPEWLCGFDSGRMAQLSGFADPDDWALGRVPASFRSNRIEARRTDQQEGAWGRKGEISEILEKKKRSFFYSQCSQILRSAREIEAVHRWGEDGIRNAFRISRDAATNDVFFALRYAVETQYTRIYSYMSGVHCAHASLHLCMYFVRILQ